MQACGAATGLMFVAIASLVCADIFLRNLGGSTIQWGLEVTEYLLMTASFLGAPYLLYLGEHIRVDIIVQSVSASTKRILDIVANIFGLAVCALLAWQSLAVLLDTRSQGSMVFKVLVFPEWWLNIPMTACFTLLTLEFARRMAGDIKTQGA